MAQLARDVMTPDPACCTVSMTLDQVAKLMVAERLRRDSGDRRRGAAGRRDHGS